MSQPAVEDENPYKQYGEMGEALYEAEQRGFVHDPLSLEDISYGPEDIQKIIRGDFSDLDNIPGVYGTGG